MNIRYENSSKLKIGFDEVEKYWSDNYETICDRKWV